MTDKKVGVVETKEDQADLAFLFTESTTDEVKSKVKDMFEAAVAAKTTKIEEAVKADFEKKLDEAVEAELAEAVKVLDEKVEDYIDHVTTEWLEANKLAMESTLKVERADSLLEGLRDLFTAHSVEIPLGSESVLESLTAQNEELRAALNESLKAHKDLNDAIAAAEVEAALDEACTDLPDTKAAKLRDLAENVRYRDLEDFKSKVDSFKKALFTESVSVNTDPVDGGEILSEETKKAPATGDQFTNNILAGFKKKHS